MAWIHMPTGVSAALDENPEYNFAGFCSANAVTASLAKHVSELEAEDLVEGASGHNPPWDDMDWELDLDYTNLEAESVDEAIMLYYLVQ